MSHPLQAAFRFMRAEKGVCCRRGAERATHKRGLEKHTRAVQTACPSFPRFDAETAMEGAVSTPLTLHTHKVLLH